jgi:hypothetical protein
MAQLDVAPTLATVLGLTLEGADGRALVGLLTSPPRAASFAPEREEAR